jgi:hypothetical protein
MRRTGNYHLRTLDGGFGHPIPRPNDEIGSTVITGKGKLTLRVKGKLHHIGTGSEHARTPVLMLIQDLHVRIINAATGDLIRELLIEPTRDYQPLGRPPGPQPKTPRSI